MAVARGPRPTRRHALALTSGFAVACGGAGRALGQTAPVAQPKALPFDEAVRDPDLVRMRLALIAAVKAKSVERAAPFLHADFKFGFGSGKAPAEELRAAVSANSKLWDDLHWVLIKGGRLDRANGLFFAPYVFALNYAPYEAAEAAAIVGARVPAFAAPGGAGPPVRRFGFELVRVVNWRPSAGGVSTAEWVEIEAADKKRLFVAKAFLRGILDTRATLRRDGRVWRLINIFSGD